MTVITTVEKAVVGTVAMEVTVSVGAETVASVDSVIVDYANIRVLVYCVLG